jgi:hypothetical protein
MYSDHFELICLQMEKLRSEGTWPGWENYMTGLIKQSPALREHFRETASWVTAQVFREIAEKGFELAEEDPPAFGRRPKI